MPPTSLSVTISVPDEGIETLFGSRDENLKQLERCCDIQIRTDGHGLLVTGSALNIQRAERIVDGLVGLLRDGYHFSRDDVRRAAVLVGQDLHVDLRDFFVKGPLRVSDKRQITPKSVNQKKYLDAIDQHDVVFGIGPAGTGKTYLAMAQAVAYLPSKRVRRIILARPAVEAGETLGFLPGDLQAKVNPYLRPLYDALYDMLDADRVERLIGRDVIEIAPLAFMRGRTLNDAFVILDEAQNTTTEQMKMFLTRLGFGSKAVVTGDITQIDLPPGRTSGVVQAIDILRNIDGMSMVFFNDRDVARHPLVQRVVNAYQTSSSEEVSHSKADAK